MHTLPHQVDSTRYWQELYHQPLPFWQAALDRIMVEHQLATNSWARAALGRNIVFVSPTAVSLAAWYRGYGWTSHVSAARDQHQIMARAMLYYAEDFARLIQTVPGAAQCRDWHAMAAAFWRLTAA